MPGYAIITVGGKQYRVREGERLLVERLAVEESKTFHPDVLLVGGNGDADLAPKGVQVTVRVVGHVLGKKIRIGKYKAKKGYRRHLGHRSRLTQIEIESIGKKGAPKKEATADKPKAKAEPKAKPATMKAEAKKPATKPKKTTTTRKKTSDGA